MPQILPGLNYTDNGNGTFTFVNDTGVTLPVKIEYSTNTSDAWVSALGELGLSLANGNINQPVWSWLQTYKPTEALGYSGTAYAYADAYELTNQAEVENHSFEVISGHRVGGPGLFPIIDAWPDVILRDFLVTNSGGVGWRAGRLSSLTQFTAYTRARKLWLTVAMTAQKPARDWLQGMAEVTNSEWVWQGGQLDLVPRGDEAISSSWGTYTPNITPVFDLVHGEGGDLLDAVEIEPVVNEDAHNVIKIEWTNRANNYAIEVMTATDQAHIELFGERPGSVIALHAIHDPVVAQAVAQQLLQRQMTVWNKYRFKVPFSRALMGLMDLSTLTDPDSSLLRVPVRITSRSESGSMEYTYEAEDAPIGSAAAPLYGAQAGAGFAHDYNVAPGPVAAPSIFEAPTEQTLSGLEVFAAVSGQAGTAGQYWGGCTVHVSLDGLNYKPQTRLYGGARYGQLTAAMATSGNAAVTLAGRGGQMLSGSAEDAAALSTLCWVDGPQGGEYFSYQTAALTAANAYTLSGLVRGAYRNPIAAHASGAAFVRVDNALAKSGPLASEMVGKKIYFKFTSFNVYGGGEQALADAVEYSYTITGGQLRQPPVPVDNLKVIEQPNGTRQIFWRYAVPPPDLFSFELAYTLGDQRPAFDDMVLLTAKDRDARQTETTEPIGDGLYTFAIRAVDTTGNKSEPTYHTVLLVKDAFGVIDAAYFPHQLGWPGLKVDCFVEGGALVNDGVETWDDFGEMTWDELNDRTWAGTPLSPCSHTHTIDRLTSAARTLRASTLASGAVDTELRTSANGTVWSAWAALPSTPVTSRFYEVRWTISGADPEMYRAQIVIYL